MRNVMKERGRQENVLYNTGQRRPGNMDLLLSVLDLHSWDPRHPWGAQPGMLSSVWLFQTSSDRLQYQESSEKGWS